MRAWTLVSALCLLVVVFVSTANAGRYQLRRPDFRIKTIGNAESPLLRFKRGTERVTYYNLQETRRRNREYLRRIQQQRGHARYVRASDNLKTFYDFLVAQDLTRVCKLFRKADLGDVLNSVGPFTLFAPSNEAFSFIPGSILETLEKDQAKLRRFLLYHIVPGSLPSVTFQDDHIVNSAAGYPLRLNVYQNGQILTVSGSQITEADLKSGDSIVHVIDHAFYRPPRFDLPNEIRNNHNSLYKLLVQADMADSLGAGIYTFFVPSDDAFLALPNYIKDALFTNSSLLDRVLMNHILSGSFVRAGLPIGYSLQPLDGGPLHFSTRRGLILVNGIPIVNSDNLCFNGVIHVINRVLLSPDILEDCQCLIPHTTRSPDVRTSPPTLPTDEIEFITKPTTTRRPTTPEIEIEEEEPTFPPDQVTTIPDSSSSQTEPKESSDATTEPTEASTVEKESTSRLPPIIPTIVPTTSPVTKSTTELESKTSIPVSQPETEGNDCAEGDCPPEFDCGPSGCNSESPANVGCPQGGNCLNEDDCGPAGCPGRTSEEEKDCSGAGNCQPTQPSNCGPEGCPGETPEESSCPEGENCQPIGKPEVDCETAECSTDGTPKCPIGSDCAPVCGPEGCPESTSPSDSPVEEPSLGCGAQGCPKEKPECPNGLPCSPNQTPASDCGPSGCPEPATTEGPAKTSLVCPTGEDCVPIEPECDPAICPGNTDPSTSPSTTTAYPGATNEIPDIDSRKKPDSRPQYKPELDQTTTDQESTSSSAISTESLSEGTTTLTISSQQTKGPYDLFGGVTESETSLQVTEISSTTNQVTPTLGLTTSATTETGISKASTDAEQVTKDTTGTEKSTEVTEPATQVTQQTTTSSESSTDRTSSTLPESSSTEQSSTTSAETNEPSDATSDRFSEVTEPTTGASDEATSENAQTTPSSADSATSSTVLMDASAIDSTSTTTKAGTPTTGTDNITSKSPETTDVTSETTSKSPEPTSATSEAEGSTTDKSTVSTVTQSNEADEKTTKPPTTPQNDASQSTTKPESATDTATTSDNEQTENSAQEVESTTEAIATTSVKEKPETLNQVTEKSTEASLTTETLKPATSDQTVITLATEEQTTETKEITTQPSEDKVTVASIDKEKQTETEATSLRTETPIKLEPVTSNPEKDESESPKDTEEPEKETDEPSKDDEPEKDEDKPDKNDQDSEPDDDKDEKPKDDEASEKPKDGGDVETTEQPEPSEKPDSESTKLNEDVSTDIPVTVNKDEPNEIPQKESGIDGKSKPREPEKDPETKTTPLSEETSTPEVTPTPETPLEEPYIPIEEPEPQTTPVENPESSSTPEPTTSLSLRDEVYSKSPVESYSTEVEIKEATTSPDYDSQHNTRAPTTESPDYPEEPEKESPAEAHIPDLCQEREDGTPIINEPPKTVRELLGRPHLVINHRPVSFRIIIELFDQAGLNSILNRRVPLTFCIPSDSAFASIPKHQMDDFQKDSKALKEILLYHLITTRIPTPNLIDSLVVPSYQGSPIIINVHRQGELVLIGGSEVLGHQKAPFGEIYILNKPLNRLPEENILRALSQRPNLSNFNNQVLKCQLEKTLRGKGPFTVFAPTNEAFKNMPKEMRDIIENDKTALERVLFNHIVPRAQFSGGVTRDVFLPTLAGGRLRFRIIGDALTVNGARLQESDITTNNGIVHVVNQIMWPKSLTPQNIPRYPVGIPREYLLEHMASGLNVDTFINWIKEAGLMDNLHNGNPYTVFAPTETAVNSLPPTLLRTMKNNIQQLMPIVKYHIVPGEIPFDTVVNEMTLPTQLNDKAIRFNTYHNDTRITISGAPMGARRTANGLTLVVINRVLYPPIGDILLTVSKSPLLQDLAQAIKISGLEEELSGPGPLTLFAPTEAAFRNLPKAEYLTIFNDPDKLRDLILRHLVKGTIYSAGVSDNMVDRSENGNEVIMTLRPQCLVVNGVNVLYSDITATNGVVHVLDHLL